MIGFYAVIAERVVVWSVSCICLAGAVAEDVTAVLPGPGEVAEGEGDGRMRRRRPPLAVEALAIEGL